MGIFSKKSKHKRSATTHKNKTPLLPASVQSFIAHRLTDTAGCVFGFMGLALLLSLVTYNAKDPSLNTATNIAPDQINNMLGLMGAYTSDILLQTLGLAAYLASIAFIVWGYRILRRKPLQSFGGRMCFLIVGIITGAIALARIPAFASWGLGAYLGGSAGALIFTSIGNHLQGWLGTMAFTFVTIVAASAFFITYTISLGVSLEEWISQFRKLRDVLSVTFAKISSSLLSFKNWHSKYTAEKVSDGSVYKSKRQVRLNQDSYAEAEDKKDLSTLQLQANDRKPIVAQRAEAKKSAKVDTKQKKLNLRSSNEEWQIPPLDFLEDSPEGSENINMDEEALQKNAEILHTTLDDFGVQGEILKVHPGPIITLYEMEPAPGTKTSRVIGLADDIARSMSAVSVRVAVVPGKNAIGIELPNAKRETVFLKDLLASDTYDKTTAKLPLVLGKNISGEPVVADLSRMPHLLVAGTTGSGKSVAINTMIMSLLYKLSPEQCRLIMIDPKMLELSVYDDIPHLLTPVVTEAHRAVTALKWAVREMEDRYRAMSKLGVRNLDGFNDRVAEARDKGEVLTHKIQTGFDLDTGKPVYEEQPIPLIDLPRIVIIVDEFADLMLVAGKEVENAIQRLAQMARAAGIHLIMATQRPSVDVITGVVKANFPTRISFQVTSKIDSRTILGDGGAETLLGQGDMLYMASGGRLKRVHGPFISDEEVEDIVDFLKEQGVPEYIDGVTEDDGEGDAFGENGGEKVDELYDHAVAIVMRERKVSTSFIQRQLQIGYNRAARMVEQMERDGLISSANGAGKREILVDHFGT